MNVNNTEIAYNHDLLPKTEYLSKNEKYWRTLFIPPLIGNHKLWKTRLIKSMNKTHAIIQMGNLVNINGIIKDNPEKYNDNGPNFLLLKLARLYDLSTASYTQLIGPNEIAALNLPKEWTSPGSNAILREGWLSDNDRFFTAAVSNGKLITHGGLTYGEWLAIGSPDNASIAAQRLNFKYNGTLTQGDCYQLGGPPNYAANPIWADAALELIPSWITAPQAMPFEQIYASGRIDSATSKDAINDRTILSHADKIITRSFGSYITIKGKDLLGLTIDLDQSKENTRITKERALYVEKVAI